MRRYRSYERSSVLASLGVHRWLLRECAPPRAVICGVHGDIIRVSTVRGVFPVYCGTGLFDWHLQWYKTEVRAERSTLFNPVKDVAFVRILARVSCVHNGYVMLAVQVSSLRHLWLDTFVVLHDISRSITHKKVKCRLVSLRKQMDARNTSSVLFQFHSYCTAPCFVHSPPFPLGIIRHCGMAGGKNSYFTPALLLAILIMVICRF